MKTALRSTAARSTQAPTRIELYVRAARWFARTPTVPDVLLANAAVLNFAAVAEFAKRMWPGAEIVDTGAVCDTCGWTAHHHKPQPASACTDAGCPSKVRATEMS